MRKIREKLKKNMILLSISLVFISMAFNRVMVSKYGRDWYYVKKKYKLK